VNRAVENSVALFTADPNKGLAPLDVNFFNSSQGAGTFLWSFGTDETSNLKDPSYTFAEGEYDVILYTYSQLAMCPDTFSVRIIVEGTSFITIPNVFSPNGDNTNDEFYVTSEGLKTFEMKIFNRWGTLIYVLKDPAEKWSGKNLKGEDCSNGTYFYVLTAEGADQKHNLSGNITLLK
jgi:gliding motility-associated-like protein